MLGYSLSLVTNFIFVAYIYVLLFRFLLQKHRASWANPISQFTYKLTEPLVKPFRKIIPNFKGFDTPLIFFAILLEFINIILLVVLRVKLVPGVLGVLLVVIASLGIKFVNIYFYSTIIVAIMSWFPALQQGPVAEVVYLITYPPLSWIKRYIPSIAGMDFSPLIFILLLLLINTAILSQLFSLGMRLALHI